MGLYVKFTFISGLRQKPKDFDFSITPTLIFSRPPEDVTIIDRGKAFALALEWGYWAIAVWFVFTKPEQEECIGCEYMFDSAGMETDNAGEKYCPQCWEVLAPIMKQEYDDLVARGEIDPNE